MSKFDQCIAQSGASQEDVDAYMRMIDEGLSSEQAAQQVLDNIDGLINDNFSNWFGDSKVVDENGEPLTLYHGTDKDFEAFKTKDPNSVFGGSVAGWFSNSSDVGSVHGPAVYPVHLNISNPVDPAVVEQKMMEDVRRFSQEERDGLRDSQARKDLLPFGVKNVEYAKELGYDGFVFDQDGTTTYVPFDPTQIKSAVGNRGTYDPNDPNILNQAVDRNTQQVDAYRKQQEARPISDVVTEPLRNANGEYRRNSKGDITGAPEGIKTDEDVISIIERNLALMDDPLTQMPSSADWYEVSGDAIRRIAHGDPQLMEKIVRVAALLSPSNKVGGNTTGFIKAAYQMVAGEPVAAGRFPNKIRPISANVLAAEDMSLDVPGVNDKVLSFYRNLWDATFRSNKYENAATMDMWMARLYGYPGDTFTPAAYRFANYITQQITQRYNQTHGTDLKPRQIQAALWVYARNLETYGDAVGADIATTDRSAFDTYIDKATQNITVEAIPSVVSGLSSALNGASLQTRKQFTRDSIKLILQKDGTNELFERIGVPLYSETDEAGSFEGAVNPNEIMGMVASGTMGAPDFTKVDLAATTLAYIYTQDGVPWFQLNPNLKGGTQGLAVQFDQEVDFRVMNGVVAHLSNYIKGADFTRKGDTLLFFNFTDQTNAKFKKAVTQAMEEYNGPGAANIQEILSVKGKTNYIATDWSNPEQAVANLEDQIRTAGSPDLLKWARDRRRAHGKLIDRYESKLVLAQSDGRGGQASDEQRGGRLPVTDDGRVPLTHWGHVEGLTQLDPAFQGTGAAGREARRTDRPPRTYFGLPGYDVTRDPGVRYTGQHQYYTTLDPSELYDLDIDPDGLFVRVRDQKTEANRIPGLVITVDSTDIEKAIIEAGYKGYWTNNPQLGPVAAVFEPTEVQPVPRGTEALQGDEDILHRLQDNEAQAVLDDMFQRAENHKVEFDRHIEEMAEMVTGYAMTAPLKRRKKTVAKVESDYKGDPTRMQDILRATVVVSNAEDVPTVVQQIKERFETKPNIRDLYENDVWDNAYQDVKINVVMEGDVHEIQVNTFEMIVAKEAYGHEYYDQQVKIEQKYPPNTLVSDYVKEDQAAYKKLTEAQAELYGYAKKAHREDTPFDRFAEELQVVAAKSTNGLDQFELSISDMNESFETRAPFLKAVAGLYASGGFTSYRIPSPLGNTATGMPSTSSNRVPSGNSNIDITSVDSIPQRMEQARRAYFEIENRVIRLTKASDLSSFLHESAHLFLEMEKEMAATYGVDDVQQQLLDWLGVESFQDITREEHEKFAETFEVYLREGKAPSLGLRDAFHAFKRWLTRLYQSLTDPRLGRAELTPEITEVFDRLLATEAEIARAQANPIYDEYFQSPDQLGMSDAEWEKRQKQRQRVIDKAEQTLEQKAFEAYYKQRKREWAKEKAPIVEEQMERLAQEPVNVVRIAASQAKMDAGMVKEILGVEKIPGRLLRYVQRDGVDPAEYAEVTNYVSAESMLKNMMSEPTMKQAADEAAQQIMIDRHGDILNDGTIEMEAEIALQDNEEQAKLLLMEANALARKTGKPKVDREYLKAMAKQQILGLKYKEIRPDKFRRQEIRAARKLGEATTDEQRLNARVQMLSNHYLYNEARDARDRMTRYRKHARRVQTRNYDTKQVNPAHVAKMKSLVEMYDLRVTSKDQAVAKLNEILEWVDGQITADTTEDITIFDINVMEGYVRKKNGEGFDDFDLPTFDDLTYEQLIGLHEMLSHLRYVGGKMADEQKAEFNLKKKQLAEWIIEHGGDDVDTPGRPTNAQNEKDDAKHFIFSLANMRNLMRKLDGFNEDGLAAEILYSLVDRGNSDKMMWSRRVHDLFEEHMHNLHNVKLKRNDWKSYVKEDGSTVEFTSEHRFMFTLYWGTDSSREALRQAYGVTDVDAARIMADMTPEQLEMVNAKWALNEELWPHLAEVTKMYDGVVPAKLDAMPFEVNGVRMTGGHSRLFYDSSNIELKSQAEETSVGSMGSIAAQKTGSMHARVGSAGMPVLLDKNNMLREMEDNIHYLAYGPVSRELAGLINSKDIRDAIVRKHGRPFYENMVESLTRITGNKHERETSRLLARVSRTLRRAATMKHLAFSIRNTIQQFTVTTIAMQEIGPLEFVARMGQYLTRPKETMDFVNAKSSWMVNRAALVNREANEFINEITASGKADYWYKKVTASSFVMQTFVDRMFAYPIWMSRYEAEMNRHGDEAKAVTAAVDAVAETVGAGDDLHLGGLFSSKNPELIRTATVFGSWFNSYFQRIYRDIGRMRTEPSMDSITQAMVTILAQPVLVGTIAALTIMDYPDEEDEPEDWIKWAGGESAKFLLGTVPLVRDMTGAFEGFSPRSPFGEATMLIPKEYNEVMQTIEGRQSGFKATIDSLKILTGVVPVPGSGQLLRSADHLDAVNEGEEDFHLIQMLVEGRNRND